MRHGLCALLALCAGMSACKQERVGAGPLCSMDAGPPEVTTQSLLAEMRSLEHLTRVPAPSYRAYQATSHDPRSETPDEPGRWHGNRDRGNFVRDEMVGDRVEHVLLETEGAGALVRIWSATPQGVLRVYVDCDVEPVIEEPMAALLSGRVEPFAEPFGYSVTVVDSLRRGGNLYFPIPFQTYVRVTVDDSIVELPSDDEDEDEDEEDEDDDDDDDEEPLFYHVGYRLYEAGTRVESFAPSVLAELADEIAQSATVLETGMRPEGEMSTHVLSGDSQIRIDAPDGGGQITELRIRSDGDAARLREMILTVVADGIETVSVPLNDFFGSGPRSETYESLPMAIEHDDKVSRWPMPFRDQIEISVESPEASSEEIELDVRLVERAWSDDSLYFHAKWHSEHPFEAERQDLTLASLRGAGVFVGHALWIANDSKCWWGEGDERIWVDSASEPSFHGTGTEDYFGYAWAQRDEFARPFHGQPLVDSGLSTRRCTSPFDSGGVAAMFRWHVLDPIPYSESFRFDLEVWHWQREAMMAMDAVTYWYAPESGSDDFASLSPAPPRILRVEELEPG